MIMIMVRMCYTVRAYCISSLGEIKLGSIEMNESKFSNWIGEWVWANLCGDVGWINPPNMEIWDGEIPEITNSNIYVRLGKNDCALPPALGLGKD